MNATNTAALSLSLLLALAVPVHAQEEVEAEPAGRVLCFQVEGLFVRAREQAQDLRETYDRLCANPTAYAGDCFDELRRDRGHRSDLHRLYKYRQYGNRLRRKYGEMCGGALNETLDVITETIGYIRGTSGEGSDDLDSSAW